MSAKAKICGINSREALDAALEGGAAYVGLVFFPKSPRNVSTIVAADLADQARGKTKIVALVVDADDAALAEIVEGVRPDFLQLHGHESPARVETIERLFRIPVIKAIAVANAADVALADAYRNVADLVLFDAKAPRGAALPGGNGLAFDWSALEDRRGTTFMLSGGLTPENVADAIRQTGAQAVDVSSGVESAPGVKDPMMIRRFLDATKEAKQN